MEVDDCPDLRLDGLPNELLLHIFQYLDVEFILQAVSKVLSILSATIRCNVYIFYWRCATFSTSWPPTRQPGGSEWPRDSQVEILCSLLPWFVWLVPSNLLNTRSVSCPSAALGLLLVAGMCPKRERSEDVEGRRGGAGREGHHQLPHCPLCSCKIMPIPNVFKWWRSSPQFSISHHLSQNSRWTVCMWWTRWWWAGAGIGASASGRSTRCCCSCAPMMMMMMMVDQVCDCSPQGHQHNIQYNFHFFATTFLGFGWWGG